MTRSRPLLSLGLAGAVAAALATTAPVAAQDKLEQLQEQGYARIAIANEPPFTQVNPDGTVTGAAPEVARAIFERLGVEEIVASITEYGAMIPSLQAGRVDAVTAGLFMRPERCAAVAYSEPVLCDAEAFLLAAGNPEDLTSYADIAASDTLTIGAPGGGTEERLALEAGVPRDRVIVVPDGQSGLNMLEDGRIDVYSLPELSLQALLDTSSNPDALEIVAPLEDGPIYCDGAAFNVNDTDLRDAFDVELAAMKESGEFAEIIEPFGFSAASSMATTREEQCAQE